MKVSRLCQPEREIEAENDGIEYAVARGWWTCKFTTPSMNGVPDRIFFRGNENGDRRAVMVEWKQDGEVPTTQQEKRHKELREHGVEVYWFSRATFNDFKRVMR